MDNKRKGIGIFIAAILVIAVTVTMPIDKVEATPVVEVQIAMILDGSGSIGSANWVIIKEGVASAVENTSCVPHDGTVELTVVQFSDSATVEVGPVIITASNAGTVANNIRAISQMASMTCIACGIHVAADALANSPNFDPSIKQVLNLATDGEPNVCDPTWPCPDAKANAVSARDYAISLLGMDTDLQDEFDAEAIGSAPDVIWLRDSIVWPQPGNIAPPFVSGWVRVVADAQEFADTVCEKFEVITPTPTPTPVLEVPAITPIGTVALIGVLSVVAIAAMTIGSRRKR